ncbi:putative serine/threonine-protein kinase PknA [Phytohabitans suffuscus]|uniref:non-specific serine/threonine protein kinase n=1 Tax=Phytohabitans suffuscus TaxID=624315 RepID=A0A6F8YZW1_9ACTN|nr:serine/threonine-protein kinase [Phytohabitans suffuscus]BCB91604.1 putative serine/threonine-protein kinase PknA [Phytohabitans suffuscus]
MLRSGVSLDDRYRLEERVATGGMGDVWRATDLALGRTVAVKVLLPGLSADPGFAARFLAESRMLAAVRHPGVVQVYDRGECDLPDGTRAAYLVMEFVDGEPLSARLAREGRLPAAEAMRIVAEAARALDAVHAGGIVHRDVKPSNLLLRPDGSVVLLDFGVARSAAVTSVTGTNAAVLGTALYMAPEQARREAVSPATDVYALGAVAYHALAGQPPFVGDNPVAVAMMHLDTPPPDLPADVPPAVRAVVLRSLEKDPADRYRTGASLASAALSAVGAGPLESTAEMAADDLDATAPVPAGTGGRVDGAGRAAVPVTRPAGPGETGVLPPARFAGGGSRRRTVAVVGALAGAALLVLLALFFLPDGETPPADGVTPTAPSATAGATSAPAGQEQPERPRETGAATPSEAPATGGATSTPEPSEEPTPPAGGTTAPDEPEPSQSEGNGAASPGASPPPAAGGTPRAAG